MNGQPTQSVFIDGLWDDYTAWYVCDKCEAPCAIGYERRTSSKEAEYRRRRRNLKGEVKDGMTPYQLAQAELYGS